MEPKSAAQLTVGVLMVVVGTLLFGQQLHYWPTVNFHHLWPVLLIVLGVAIVLKPGEDGRRNGFMLLVLGMLFLLQNYDVMSVRQSWPLALVAWGISVAVGGLGPRTGGGKDSTRVN